MNIEEVAATNPDAIITEPIDINKGIGVTCVQGLCDFLGIQREQAERLARKLGFDGDQLQQTADIFERLYSVFIEYDSTMLEINPLAEDSTGTGNKSLDADVSTNRQFTVYCMDCKMNFDDNAFFRQKKVFDLRDWSQVC